MRTNDQIINPALKQRNNHTTKNLKKQSKDQSNIQLKNQTMHDLSS